MKKSLIIVFLVIAGFTSQNVWAQLRNSGSSTITYEVLYDAPYDINKLFVHFQPVYGEMFVTNITAGFGMEAQYYLKNKFDFRAHARKAYAQKFDFERDVAEKNTLLSNKPEIYNYYEFGATYHIKDEESDTDTKIILYSSRYKGRKWASQVPDEMIAPSKVRKIYGARLGGMFFDSSTDLARATQKQGVYITDNIGDTLSGSYFGNIDVKGLYLGGSICLIKNFAIKPDKGYGTLTNDLIFTAFFDILVAPSITIDDIYLNQRKYSTENVKTNLFGFRAGMDGKFNREFGWGYGAELGYRPSVKTRGFYALFKISFPIYSTNLDYRREAFGK